MSLFVSYDSLHNLLFRILSLLADKQHGGRLFYFWHRLYPSKKIPGLIVFIQLLICFGQLHCIIYALYHRDIVIKLKLLNDNTEGSSHRVFNTTMCVREAFNYLWEISSNFWVKTGNKESNYARSP